MASKDARREDYRTMKVREIEVQVQRLFEPIPARIPRERCIVVRTVGNTRLVRRVIES